MSNVLIDDDDIEYDDATPEVMAGVSDDLQRYYSRVNDETEDDDDSLSLGYEFPEGAHSRATDDDPLVIPIEVSRPSVGQEPICDVTEKEFKDMPADVSDPATTGLHYSNFLLANQAMLMEASQRRNDGANHLAEVTRSHFLKGLGGVNTQESIAMRYLQGPHPFHGSPDFAK